MVQTDNKRIVKNTIMLYIRMGIVMAVTLYTSRIILNVLGIVNYGIYSVIGGVIALLSFVNTSMSLSVQRFLSYALGKNDENKVNNLFSLSVIIHIFIASFVGVIFLISGNYIITNYLDIPFEKTYYAQVFFKWIVLSSCLNIIQVPYTGLVIAYEKMSILTWSSISDVLMKLLAAFAVLWFKNEDVLIIYGIFLAGTSMANYLLLCVLCHLSIKNIRLKWFWDKTIFIQLFSFASWSALGEIAWALTLQGTNILLNLFVGVICNAAYGIASQISGAVNRFIASFTTAVNPQIIKLYAAKRVEEMTLLTLRSIKFSFFLVLILGLPLFVRMPIVLRIWLGEIPEYAVIFCQLIIITILFDCLSTLFATVAKAYGKIRNYQLIVSSVLILNFPLNALILKMGFPPYSIFLVYSLVSIALLVVRLQIISRMLDLKIGKVYFLNVIIPILKVLVATLTALIGLHLLLPDDLLGTVILILGCLTIISFSTYMLGLTVSEKNLINQQLKKIKARFI